MHLCQIYGDRTEEDISKWLDKQSKTKKIVFRGGKKSLKYRTFNTEEISSWQEDVKTNTIMIYNGKYDDIRQEND